MANYYNSSQSSPVTLQVQDAFVCTQGDVRCQDEVSQVCDDNVWVNGGSACDKPQPTIDPMLMLVGVGLVAVLGVAVVAGAGKGKK